MHFYILSTCFAMDESFYILHVVSLMHVPCCNKFISNPLRLLIMTRSKELNVICVVTLAITLSDYHVAMHI